MMNKKTLAIFIAGAALLALPLIASAQATNKLVVQDSGQNDVFTVDDAGNVNATGKSAVGTASPATSTLTIVDETGAATRGIGAYQASSDTFAGVVDFRKMRGAYTETPTTANSLLQGDYVGAFHGWGVDTTGVWRRGATLSYYVDAPPTNGGVPIAMAFFTGSNDNGLANPKAERLTVSSNGDIKISAFAVSHVGGSAYVCVNSSGVLYTSETGCP